MTYLMWLVMLFKLVTHNFEMLVMQTMIGIFWRSLPIEIWSNLTRHMFLELAYNTCFTSSFSFEEDASTIVFVKQQAVTVRASVYLKVESKNSDNSRSCEREAIVYKILSYVVSFEKLFCVLPSLCPLGE